MNNKITLLISLLSLTTISYAQDSITQKDGYDLNETELIAKGYVKVFEDDFSSDFSKWNIWNGGAYNNELQHYQRNNLDLQHGKLVITAKKEQITGKTLPEKNNTKTFSYSSGRIESKLLFTPTATTPTIRISARIMLPLGAGMWPAFWTYGNNWPSHGEIDILEATGKSNSYITNYFYGKNAGKADTNGDITVKTINSAQDLTTSYHVYEVIWTKNTLTYLLDGKVVDIKSAETEAGKYIPGFYEKPHQITLNLAVGGNIFQQLDPSTIKPGTMYVDWVKVFSNNLIP